LDFIGVRTSNGFFVFYGFYYDVKRLLEYVVVFEGVLEFGRVDYLGKAVGEIDLEWVEKRQKARGEGGLR
jgi:hypothetical protein